MHASPEECLALLGELGIEHSTVTHRPVFTVDEARAIRGGLGGGHSKNLFLRNKKGAMWLVTCEEQRAVDLRHLAEALGANRFSFASPERLMRHLGVTPGAVTPFAVMNDREGVVKVALDRALLGFDRLSFHPLDNARTTTIASRDLLRFLDAVDHPPALLDFETLTRGPAATAN